MVKFQLRIEFLFIYLFLQLLYLNKWNKKKQNENTKWSMKKKLSVEEQINKYE